METSDYFFKFSLLQYNVSQIRLFDYNLSLIYQSITHELMLATAENIHLEY